eukprot:763039-Hanusia_phi.AAC.1
MDETRHLPSIEDVKGEERAGEADVEHADCQSPSGRPSSSVRDTDMCREGSEQLQPWLLADHALSSARSSTSGDNDQLREDSGEEVAPCGRRHRTCDELMAEEEQSGFFLTGTEMEELVGFEAQESGKTEEDDDVGEIPIATAVEVDEEEVGEEEVKQNNEEQQEQEGEQEEFASQRWQNKEEEEARGDEDDEEEDGEILTIRRYQNDSLQVTSNLSTLKFVVDFG